MLLSPPSTPFPAWYPIQTLPSALLNVPPLPPASFPITTLFPEVLVILVAAFFHIITLVSSAAFPKGINDPDISNEPDIMASPVNGKADPPLIPES